MLVIFKCYFNFYFIWFLNLEISVRRYNTKFMCVFNIPFNVPIAFRDKKKSVWGEKRCSTTGRAFLNYGFAFKWEHVFFLAFFKINSTIY